MKVILKLLAKSQNDQLYILSGIFFKGYLIEKRLPRGEWRKATGSLVPGTEATVTGIEEGQTYEFRVSAVNDAGPGKPSKATGPHLVRDPVCKLN